MKTKKTQSVSALEKVLRRASAKLARGEAEKAVAIVARALREKPAEEIRQLIKKTKSKRSDPSASLIQLAWMGKPKSNYVKENSGGPFETNWKKGWQSQRAKQGAQP